MSEKKIKKEKLKKGNLKKEKVKTNILETGDDYEMIFKRKSFHIFKTKEKLSCEDLNGLRAMLRTVKTLDDSISFEWKLVKAKETTMKVGAEYCLLLYSENKPDYLKNIGYIGEQVDLYCASKNIASLWCGIAKPKCQGPTNKDYVIMIGLAKTNKDEFREDMFKENRKEINEIWEGETYNVANIARFSPSACNSQPWKVVSKEHSILVYRYKMQEKKTLKNFLIKNDKMLYFNKIDMGIFMYILEVCLKHENLNYTRYLLVDDTDTDSELTLVAKYELD